MNEKLSIIETSTLNLKLNPYQTADSIGAWKMSWETSLSEHLINGKLVLYHYHQYNYYISIRSHQLLVGAHYKNFIDMEPLGARLSIIVIDLASLSHAVFLATHIPWVGELTWLRLIKESAASMSSFCFFLQSFLSLGRYSSSYQSLVYRLCRWLEITHHYLREVLWKQFRFLFYSQIKHACGLEQNKSMVHVVGNVWLDQGLNAEAVKISTNCMLLVL